MAAWVVVPCLVSLRGEFNTLSPDRDKGADGTIGDTAHTSVSDHTPDEDSSYLRDHDADEKNEVHALDIDASGPWPGEGTQKQRFHAIIMRLIAAEKAKWLDPLDVCRIKYVIWDRKIYHIDNNFAPRDHVGSDPHTSHAHFSARYLTRSENDTRSFNVYIPPAPVQEEDDMNIDQFFVSIGTSLGVPQGANPDVNNRNNFAHAVRFALGLNYDASRPLNEMPAGMTDQIRDDVAAIKTLLETSGE